MTFSANKIYYKFSQEIPKMTSMKNRKAPDKHFNLKCNVISVVKLS